MISDTERLDKLEAIQNIVRHQHRFGVTPSGSIAARERKGKQAPYHSLREAIDAAPYPGREEEEER